MPAVVGVLNLDRKPVDTILLGRMGHSYAEAPPERPTVRAIGHIGLACHGPASMSGFGLWPRLERDDNSRYCLDFDGRIDNPDEILEKLQLTDSTHHLSDAELLLAAYVRWGEQCLSHLLGDFSFALWDGHAGSLLVARDALGVRPLFYFKNERQFLFASFISQLLEHPDVPQAVDEEYLADFFVRGDCHNDLTPFRAIRRLLPGCSIQVTANSVSLSQYWTPDSAKKTIRYRSDQEFEEHFRSIFRASVKARLRSVGAVAAELSGGLDSSSVVCMAQDIYRSGDLPCTGFKTYTDTFGGSRFDESPLSRTVVEKYNFPSEEIPHNDFGWFRHCNGNTPCWDEPTPGLLIVSDHLERGRGLRRDRIHVLLTGIGGDQVFRGACFPRHLADSLKSLSVRRLATDLSKWQHTLGWSFSKLLLEACVRPWVWPNSLDDVPVKRRRTDVPNWLTRSFSRRMRLSGRTLKHGFLPAHYSSPALQQHYQDIFRTSSILVHGYMLGAAVEVRHPFLDRRLVEFALAIPPEQLVRPLGESKSIVRRAMKGLVPQAILGRTNKMSFDQRFYRGLQEEWPVVSGMLDNMILDSMGCVSVPPLRKELERARRGLPIDIFLLLNTLSAEVWLRTRNYQSRGDQFR